MNVRRVERHALALQVQTEDPLARAYCDFLLGDVICCDGEHELRRYPRAVTDTVMVYQNTTSARRWACARCSVTARCRPL